MQRQHRLQQPRRASGRLRVADLALDAAQRAPLLVVAKPAKSELQARKLSRIASFGARAVGLHELYGLRAVAGRLVRTAHRAGLTFCERGVHALRAAIRRGADARQHGVDLAALRFGVLEPHERKHHEAFAQHRAVGCVRERATVSGGRERWRLRETHVHEDVVHRVDAAAQHHVRVAELQLVDAHAQRCERAGTRRVGHGVGATQIEAVGDATGHHVAEQPGKARLLPRHVVRRDALADVLHLRLRQSRFPHRLDPDRSLQAAVHRAEQLLRAGHAEQGRDALAVQARQVAARRVLQATLSDHEGEQLRGVRGRHDAGRNAESHGVKVDFR